MTIRRAPNLVFEGRKPDPREILGGLYHLTRLIGRDVGDLERRLAVLEREAATNGNGERG